MFIDEIAFRAKAGDGGGGVVRWLHEKFKEYGGPSGGDGGKGGDVYVKAARDIGLLARYRQIKKFGAENGKEGGGKSKRGRDGSDLDILLPVGSVVTNLSTGRELELLRDGERVLVLRGGLGGRGNEHFKSSTNVRPRQRTPGRKGEEADFSVELRLIADVGIIGLPNAGKTSLLNILTQAHAKVGDYPFTTLQPNLGSFYGYIIADIPGLIEGASKGKGLGRKFLRHIRRTRLLLHCISLENDDVLSAYRTVRGELDGYDSVLFRRDEYVVFAKRDLVSSEAVKRAKKFSVGVGKKNIFAVSIYDKKSVKKLSDTLIKLLKPPVS